MAEWTTIEMGTGVAAGNLATLRPFYRWVFGIPLHSENAGRTTYLRTDSAMSRLPTKPDAKTVDCELGLVRSKHILEHMPSDSSRHPLREPSSATLG
jgi:catechol-2,3-dioxygenase